MSHYGSVEYQGITIKLIEDAYFGGSFDQPFEDAKNGGILDQPYYVAQGVDGEGNRYVVMWYVKEEYWDMNPNTGNFYWLDQDEAVVENQLCDWTNPDEVHKML